MSEATPHDAFRLLRALMQDNDREAWDNADSYVVVVTENEFGSMSLYGSFDDPEDALRRGAEFEKQLNSGNAPDEPFPFEVKVYPMQIPEGW